MDRRKAEEMLSALGIIIEEQVLDPVDIVVCGAMVLLLRSLITRSTRDIDGLGVVAEEEGVLELRKPVLSGEFKAATERVGALYN